MNTKLLLLFLIVAGFSRCSTAYKAGQTPDDVYYSPVRPQAEYVKTGNDENKNVSDNTAGEDVSIRISIRNRRWRRYNDYDYNYPYNNQYPPVYINPKGGITTPVAAPQPKKVNLGAYKKPGDNTTATTSLKDLKGGNQVPPPANSTTPSRTFKTGTGVGNFIRQLFSGSGQTHANTSDNNTSSTRTFSGTNNNNSNSSSGSNSSAGKSSSSSSAPVRTFNKN